jgi:hypothetical protein
MQATSDGGVCDILFFQMSFHKLYKGGVFFYIFTLKYMCRVGWIHKSLTLKAKHKTKLKYLYDYCRNPTLGQVWG